MRNNIFIAVTLFVLVGALIKITACVVRALIIIAIVAVALYFVFMNAPGLSSELLDALPV